MRLHTRSRILAAVAVVAAASAAAAGPRALGPLDGRPDAIVDLATPAGVALVQGQWRYSDTRIVETDFRAPGPDLKPSGAPIRTYDFTPHAGAAGFADSAWPATAPTPGSRRYHRAATDSPAHSGCGGAFATTGMTSPRPPAPRSAPPPPAP